jgi:hypothetical protein
MVIGGGVADIINAIADISSLQLFTLSLTLILQFAETALGTVQ